MRVSAAREEVELKVARQSRLSGGKLIKRMIVAISPGPFVAWSKMITLFLQSCTVFGTTWLGPKVPQQLSSLAQHLEKRLFHERSRVADVSIDGPSGRQKRHRCIFQIAAPLSSRGIPLVRKRRAIAARGSELVARLRAGREADAQSVALRSAELRSVRDLAGAARGGRGARGLEQLGDELGGGGGISDDIETRNPGVTCNRKQSISWVMSFQRKSLLHWANQANLLCIIYLPRKQPFV